MEFGDGEACARICSGRLTCQPTWVFRTEELMPAAAGRVVATQPSAGSSGKTLDEERFFTSGST